MLGVHKFAFIFLGYNSLMTQLPIRKMSMVRIFWFFGKHERNKQQHEWPVGFVVWPPDDTMPGGLEKNICSAVCTYMLVKAGLG